MVRIRLQPIIRGVVMIGVAVLGYIAPTTAAARVWTIVPTPNDGTVDSCLNGAGGSGSGGVWAVGGSGIYACYGSALIEQHRPGHRAWRVVPAGGLARWDFVLLRDVVAVSPTDAWAVGSGARPSGALRPVVEHWNGAVWRRTRTYGGFRLDAVARVPGTDHVWTVGVNADNRPVNLAGSWDGTRWRFMSVPAPKQGFESALFSTVAPVSDTDVWAIASTDVSEVGDVGRAYAEHWNGARWTLAWLPGSMTGNEQLFDSDVVPGTPQIWAVGRYQPLPDRRVSTLTQRYADGHWQIVPSADRGIRSELSSVVAINSDNVWAVGTWYGRNWRSHTLIEHFSHGHWTIVPSPNSELPENGLHGLAVVTHKRRRLLWAVGVVGNAGKTPLRTLALRGW